MAAKPATLRAIEFHDFILTFSVLSLTESITIPACQVIPYGLAAGGLDKPGLSILTTRSGLRVQNVARLIQLLPSRWL